MIQKQRGTNEKLLGLLHFNFEQEIMCILTITTIALQRLPKNLKKFAFKH